MADKRQVKKGIKRLQRIKTWQLVILLILFGLLTATFFRLNNVGMIERRTAVLAADKRGDESDLKDNLFALQRYSAAHMNASTGLVYLEKEYERESQRRMDAAKKSSIKVKDVLEKADKICRARYSGYGVAYSQCNLDEQAKYKGMNALPSVVNFPNPELYRHEFLSPAWSPDFAGFSLLVCVVITVVIILRVITLLILKALLRRHYSSI
ncbi:MAG TPA: hypothetical protein VGE34_03610 [Candidatus Saccharimonadales bacterium]